MGGPSSYACAGLTETVNRPGMQGKVVVITGGTSGIGQVAAEQLASKGARLVLVARDRARGEATLARLRVRGPGVSHRAHYADLSGSATPGAWRRRSRRPSRGSTS